MPICQNATHSCRELPLPRNGAAMMACICFLTIMVICSSLSARVHNRRVEAITPLRGNVGCIICPDTGLEAIWRFNPERSWAAYRPLAPDLAGNAGERRGSAVGALERGMINGGAVRVDRSCAFHDTETAGGTEPPAVSECFQLAPTDSDLPGR